ncbi:MAG: cyclic nucleotide-binding domain-containing protein, partial [Deltaproteobacteria bacterium]|nr:cyclic nucleotide-binding domain-containing protein [Deltaproteobacteria bacterium]
RYLSELTMEIAHSDRKDFREFLKKRREFMEDFIQRLDKEAASEKRQVISMDRLRKVEILQGLAEWDLQSIAPFFQEENLAAGISLCEEGTRADQLYILEQGSVSLQSQKCGRVEIDTPGKIVGWSFLVPPYRYTASAATITPSKLLVIKSPDFYYLIHKEPKMGVKIMDNLAQVMASRMRVQEGNPEAKEDPPSPTRRKEVSQCQ